ncbi:MAG: malate synthase G, partial [Ilumatobacteraceae bacterium]
MPVNEPLHRQTVDSPYVPRAELLVGAELVAMLESEALPASGVDPAQFWQGLAALIHDFAPRNAELLAVRAELQAAIDRWHRQHVGQPHDAAAYRAFLEEIGYLVPTGPAFSIDTDNLDPEISTIPGPQLVVPVTNARYAVNAANARWGSLYDALYGTDALGDHPSPGPYDPARGQRVIEWGRSFLDDAAALAPAGGSPRSHRDAVAYQVIDGAFVATYGDGSVGGLADPAVLAGYNGNPAAPTSILLEHHGLGIEIVIDRAHPVGSTDSAGVADLLLESAVTSIMDFEDSIAAVDSADKAHAYHNWLGLVTGTLTEEATKNGTTFTRSMAPDRTFTAPDGSPL